LEDGNLKVGWPEMSSSARSQPDPKLHLAKVRSLNKVDSIWVDLEGVKGILQDVGQIIRIAFLES